MATNIVTVSKNLIEQIGWTPLKNEHLTTTSKLQQNSYPSLMLRLRTGQVLRWNVIWKRTGKDGKRMKKDEKRMKKDGNWMGKGANIAITYRYSIDIGEDFAKLDSDPARTCQLQVRHGVKR